MSTVQRVARNAIVLYAAYILNAALAIVLSIAVARELGDEAFGKYSFATAFTLLFAVFMDLGFNPLITREVARDKSLASQYLGNIIVIRAMLSVVIYGLIFLVINLMDYPSDTTTIVLIFGIHVIFTSFADIFRVTLRAFERMEYEALISALSRLIIVSLGVAALFLDYGLIEIAFGFVIGSAVDIILSSIICFRKFARPKLESNLDFWKSSARVALPMSVLSIAMVIYNRTDTVMLSSMRGDAEVGWYNAAYNLIVSWQFIPTIFLTALFPTMSIFFVSSQSSLKVINRKSLQYLFIIILPIAVGTTMLADRVIPLFYGDQFDSSVIAIQILIWSTLLVFMYMPLAYLLSSMNKQNQMAIICVAGAILNVILNIVMITKWGYIGASIATILSQVFLFFTSYYLVSRYLYKPPLHKIVAKPIVACAIMAAFVYFCSSLNLAVIIIMAVVLYFVALFAMREFSGDDLLFLKQAARNRKQQAEPIEYTDSHEEAEK